MSIVHCARYVGLIRQVIGVVTFIAVIVDGETVTYPPCPPGPEDGN
jgi:hypothetical protein